VDVLFALVQSQYPLQEALRLCIADDEDLPLRTDELAQHDHFHHIADIWPIIQDPVIGLNKVKGPLSDLPIRIPNVDVLTVAAPPVIL
jgi:hypothetical protein